MGITIEVEAARRHFLEALSLARTRNPLPDNWIRTAEIISQSPTKTYIPALGTALLARATDDRVDTLALHKDAKRSHLEPYSARNLCERVLVPCAREHGIDLGLTGKQPLNNSPFYGQKRIDEINRRIRARDDHDLLVQQLTRANGLSSSECLEAFAAFLRVRLRYSNKPPREAPPITKCDWGQLTRAITTLLGEDAENGKRAQALVAAILDLAFPEVRTQRVYDPSRKIPGDVYVLRDGEVVLSAEVRAKPVRADDVIAFGTALRRASIPAGLFVALEQRGQPLNRSQISEQLASSGGPLLMVEESAVDLLRLSSVWSAQPLADVLTVFPRLAWQRLQQLEVRPETLSRWEELCAQGLFSSD